MDVKKGMKTLWHVQNMNICSDGTPYDMFLWAEYEPTMDEIIKVFKEDTYDWTESDIEELKSSSEIYKVYAEEIYE